jgi:RNA polymerase sigma-70 factor, ECF subfamily
MLESSLTNDACNKAEVPQASFSDEDQLIALAKTHPRYFGELYDRYYNRILNYIYRRTLNVALAEEITSNTFFKALRGLPDYDHRGKFGHWLYRIAGNEIRLNWRAKRRRHDNKADWREDYARVHIDGNRASTADELEEKVGQFTWIQHALGELPEQYQIALTLRYFEGMAYDEVADVMGKKLGVVKSLIHRGLKRLRRQFD